MFVNPFEIFFVKYRRISPDLHEVIPELETIVLTNNMIQELGEIDNLVNLKYLRHLSFLFNPVSTKEHYRMYVIYRLPNLRVLDFRKIGMKVSFYVAGIGNFAD